MGRLTKDRGQDGLLLLLPLAFPHPLHASCSNREPSPFYFSRKALVVGGAVLNACASLSSHAFPPSVCVATITLVGLVQAGGRRLLHLRGTLAA